MTELLIVEDDPAMRHFLSSTLAASGFGVAEATTIAQADHMLAKAPSALLLDLGLPDGDGLTLLRRIRAFSRTPVIIISARDREDDKVVALDAGADDYLTKPFGTRELLARIRAALRRTGPPHDDPVITVGPIVVDRERHEVIVGGVPVHLTPIEFRLLEVLARHAGRALTHNQLLVEVWGTRGHDQTHYLRVHMAALRRKVEADPARPRWLVTEQGVGYRLRDE
jgi:two-component system KDP operon response regulator KdpE